MHTALSDRPAPRLRCRTVTNVRGWKIKTYGATGAARAGGELLRAAQRLAAATLPARPDLDDAYGVGFLVVTGTAGGCRALVDWWARPDELHQRVFLAPADRPAALAPAATATIGCTLELAVIDHERQAWLRHVLHRTGGPDFDGYLTDTLN